MIKPDQRLAIEAMNQRFATITEMTFLAVAEEEALVELLVDISSALALRGRSRDMQKVSADIHGMALPLMQSMYPYRMEEAKG